jgi:putative membrane protein
MQNLSPADHERLRASTAAVEARTHARFALVVVPLSDRYLLYPIVYATIASLAVGAVLALVSPHLEFRSGFIIEAAIFVALSLLIDWFPIRLMLIPKRIKHSHTRAFARAEFAARILGSHEPRHGIVFFVSLGERYVEIVADPNLHALVGEEAWSKIVADFVVAAKSGHLADGFIAAIERCGTILEGHYPRAAATPTLT